MVQVVQEAKIEENETTSYLIKFGERPYLGSYKKTENSGSNGLPAGNRTHKTSWSVLGPPYRRLLRSAGATEDLFVTSGLYQRRRRTWSVMPATRKAISNGKAQPIHLLIQETDSLSRRDLTLFDTIIAYRVLRLSSDISHITVQIIIQCENSEWN